MGLAKLNRAGAPVPEWFGVPTEFFNAHVAKASIADTLSTTLAELSKLDLNEPASLKVVQAGAEKIKGVIIAEEPPPELRAAIEADLSKLGAGPFAVRSSMVGEDSKEHSFAGQLDSFLFQTGVDEVVDSIKRCWASAFGDRSIAYHLRANLPLDAIRVGVVTQRMIDGEVSGVMFTANPTNGHREQTLLTAAWGQGEGIVSGICNTDEIVWSHKGEEVSYRIVDKDLKLIRDPESGRGTIEVDVEKEERRVRCLNDATVHLICAKGLEVANNFGSFQDIEWTVEKGKLYFVQARPITSLPPPPNTDGPVVVWDNSNIQESFNGVTTPLTFSYAQRAYEYAYLQTMEAMSISEDKIDAFRPAMRNLLGLIRGRVFYNINNWYKGLTLLPGFGRNKSDMEKMMGLEDPVDFVEDEVLTTGEKLARLPEVLKTMWTMMRAFRNLKDLVPAFLNNFMSVYRTIDRSKLPSMSFSQLMALNERIERDVLKKWYTPIINDFYVMMTNGALRRVIEKTGVENAVGIQNNVMAGEEGIESTEPTKFLMRLAKEINQKHPELATHIQENDAMASYSEIGEKYPGVMAKIEDYIERYGDRVMGELKLETITLRTNPAFVLDILRNYIARPDLDPDKLAEKEKKLRAEAEALLLGKLGPIGKMRFRRAANRAREAVKNRENMRLTRTRYFGLSRDIYVQMGERLHEAGKLDEPRDIFYLDISELEAYHEGRSVGADLGGLARVRKAEFAEYEKQDVPHHFETVGAVYHGNQYKYEGEVEVDLNASTLMGVGCYPGVVESPIRLIFSPDDELSLNGKILCTVRTDPGWAPLFPTASGILVERGSTLSHSAVVARELGIPAVVGVPGLTEIVSDAENVRMDGESGKIERLDHDPEAEG